jgi:peptidoglycan/LPS O-acetylase OafA/YrhL
MLLGSYVTIGIYAWDRPPGDQGEWTNSFFQFQFFSAGVVLAILLRGRLPQISGLLRFGAVAAGLGCWLFAVSILDVRSWDPQPTFGGAFLGWLLVLSGTVLMFIAALGLNAPRIPGWLAYLGRISFGLYVIHSLLFVLIFDKMLPALEWRSDNILVDAVATALVLALSIAFSHLSFRYFEKPILRHKSRFTYVRAREDL